MKIQMSNNFCDFNAILSKTYQKAPDGKFKVPSSKFKVKKANGSRRTEKRDVKGEAFYSGERLTAHGQQRET